VVCCPWTVDNPWLQSCSTAQKTLFLVLMKLAVLTTDTPHHTYFVRELKKTHPKLFVFAETEAAKVPFKIAHPFEKARDKHEQKVFFGGKKRGLKDVCKPTFVKRMNDAKAITLLHNTGAEIVIVFGTGKLSKEVIELSSGRIWNLHGGDSEEYRGLDSHLWAIYHGDFKSLLTTLHHVDENLDEGEIIAQLPVPLRRGMKIHELRAYNTQACLQLVRDALLMYEQKGMIMSRAPEQKGRYYSFMPSVLKNICVARFNKFAEKLKEG
jgi:methionyl-tRNA formyltransferase